MSSTKLTRQQQQELYQQEEYRNLLFHNWQLTRLAWSLVERLGGKVTLNPEEIPMLWTLLVGNTNPDQNSKEKTFKAEVLPELDEELIEKISAKLVGTKKDLHDLMVEFDLKAYPIQYMGMRLSRYLKYSPNEGEWVTLKEAEERTKAHGENLKKQAEKN